MSVNQIKCPHCRSTGKLVARYPTKHVYLCKNPKCRRKYQVDAVLSESVQADLGKKSK